MKKISIVMTMLFSLLFVRTAFADACTGKVIGGEINQIPGDVGISCSGMSFVEEGYKFQFILQTSGGNIITWQDPHEPTFCSYRYIAPQCGTLLVDFIVSPQPHGGGWIAGMKKSRLPYFYPDYFSPSLDWSFHNPAPLALTDNTPLGSQDIWIVGN